MDLIILPDPAQADGYVARLVALELRANPKLVLGLATGRTMVGVYEQLVRMYQERVLDFSRCTTFNLDEYVGLPEDHPGSYRHTMNEMLFERVNIPRSSTHLPDGMARDLEQAGRNYETLIAQTGGIDLQLLGIGEDGHIGFNEPPSSLRSRTREQVLTPATLAQNAPMFGGEAARVPRSALTMGVGTILEARRCVMLATGAAKAAILARALEGPVTSMLTASALQWHPWCQVVMDEAAAAGLRHLNRVLRPAARPEARGPARPQ